CPPSQPGCVVACTVVIKATFLIPLLARVAVAFGRLCLAAYGLVRSATEWGVLLVGDNLSLVVQFQVGRTEVIAELIANKLHRPGIIPLSAGLNQRNQVLVIHDLQGFSNQPRVCACVLLKDLESAQVDTFLLKRSVLQFGGLPQTLSAGIVEVARPASLPCLSPQVIQVAGLALWHSRLIFARSVARMPLWPLPHVAGRAVAARVNA